MAATLPTPPTRPATRSAVCEPPLAAGRGGWDTAAGRVRVRNGDWRCVSHVPPAQKVAHSPLVRRSGAGQLAEVAEQQRLGLDDLLELGEVQPLVGAVGAGVGVLDAGDEHAGLRERLEELGDERDRATDA